MGIKIGWTAGCLIMSMLCAGAALIPSGALTSERVTRTTAASVSSDSSSIFKLIGFENSLAQIGIDENVNKTYLTVGSLTNNTTKTIRVTITITPNFSQIPSNDKVCELGLVFGTLSPIVFTKSNHAAKQVTVTIAPGQRIDVKASLIRNKKNRIPTPFQFRAVDSTGTLLLEMKHTTSAPRQVIFK